MKHRFFLLPVLVVIMVSCGNHSSSTRSKNQLLQDQMVTCPMCQGSGTFSYMPGDIMAPVQTCSLCGGQRVCTADQAQQFIKMQQNIDAMMNGGGGSYYSGGGRRSVSAIESDLRKARELLEEMEDDYRNSSSVVVRSQYPSMIANQKERINQLNSELRNAR